MQENLFNSINRNDFLNFNTEQLRHFFDTQKSFADDLLIFKEKLEKENVNLKKYIKELEEKILLIEGQRVKFKNKIFDKSSEKSSHNTDIIQPNKNNTGKRKKSKATLLPSERYPDATIIERDLTLEDIPNCSCCGNIMKDSGMTEDSEYLTIIPKEYLIIRQKRHKYRCDKCHGDVKTTPCPPRIIPGSTYSDDMIMDVALSKYCDLVPIERYSTIAGREGFKDLPPQSLIGVTHQLADFIKNVYHNIKKEVMSSSVLHADETPHRMLEGDAKKRWYLWGFSTAESSYFDIRDTRSGDIASELLSKAECEYLISDVFSGYQKCVGETNKSREILGQPKIQHVYCNAHSRRKFKEAEAQFPEEAKFFIDQYKEVYRLEKIGREDLTILGKMRQKMKPLFKALKNHSLIEREKFSSKSSLVVAIDYFLKNYIGLTLFLDKLNLPIDNNHQERLLRNPVIGRKTWYGTHSKRGAETAAILFTLVESCKLNNINPRAYFDKLIHSIHTKNILFTPKEFKSINLPDTG